MQFGFLERKKKYGDRDGERIVCNLESRNRGPNLKDPTRHDISLIYELETVRRKRGKWRSISEMRTDATRASHTPTQTDLSTSGLDPSPYRHSLGLTLTCGNSPIDSSTLSISVRLLKKIKELIN